MSYLPTKNDIVTEVIATNDEVYDHCIHTTYQPVVENVASVTIEGEFIPTNPLSLSQLVCFDTKGRNVASSVNDSIVIVNTSFTDSPDNVIESIIPTEIKPFDITPYYPKIINSNYNYISIIHRFV